MIKLATDYGTWHLPGSTHKSTADSPFYLRTCVGCYDDNTADGTDFTTLDPDRILCRRCLGD